MQIDNTKEQIHEAIHNWKENQIIYPVYFDNQIELLKKRAYIHLVKVHEPILGSFEKNKKNVKDLQEFVFYVNAVQTNTNINSF
jgi:hypothetical protein